MTGGGDDRAEPGSSLPFGRLVFPFALVLAVAALTPESELFRNQGDVGHYLEKASAFASGAIPYRDFAFEYPPGALVPMAVPYLLWPFGGIDLDLYKWLFAGWEAVLMVALGLVLVRIVQLGGDAEAESGRATAERWRRTGMRLAILSAGAALAITWRFDLYPTLLMLVALWAVLEGRPGAAGVALGLGFLAKLFPVAILPALAVPWLLPLDVRGLVRLGGAFATTAIVGMVPFVLLAGAAPTFQFLAYNADRGLQVETIGGGLALLLGLATGQPVDMNFRFSSVNLEGPLASAWLALLPILTIAGFGLLAWVGWRRVRTEERTEGVRPSTVVTLATVSILMLLATAKVYSIQYVVWFLPLVALLGGRQFWLAAAIVALTMPIHPLMYAGIVGQQPLAVLMLNLRNALLVALLGWLLWGVARPARLELTTFRSAT